MALPQDSSVASGVTVAICTQDRAAALDRCLAALLSAEMLPTQIVIVDQSRDESTRTVAEKYAAKVATSHLKIRDCHSAHEVGRSPP
jgi:glycosyltransferase involved in cell wall biosynthesis